MLDTIITGKRKVPPRIVMYGTHGIGKSTLCAKFPKPVFIDTEGGLDAIETSAFPRAEKIADVVNAIRALLKDKHDFKTVVVDSADWLVSLIELDIEANNDAQALSYGKGAIMVAEAFREVLQGLDRCRANGMNVVLLAHAVVTRFDSPEVEPFDRYAPNLTKRCNNLLMEWCDVLAFANTKTIVKKSEVGFGNQVSRGVSTGERLLHLNEKPAYMAKNRFGGPDSIPMTIEAINDTFPLNK